MHELCCEMDSSRLKSTLDYTYVLVNTREFDMQCTVKGSGNSQSYFRLIDIEVERELLLRVQTGTFYAFGLRAARKVAQSAKI